MMILSVQEREEQKVGGTAHMFLCAHTKATGSARVTNLSDGGGASDRNIHGSIVNRRPRIMASILRVNTLTDASSNNSIATSFVAGGSAKLG